jgi:3-hydroxyisobutyrate dehydrogenase-like beta-hydroxyacid dehydrogenase
MTSPIVGILHPGAMGISVAATMINSGHDVHWTSEGRSEESKQRAAEHRLTDVGILAVLCQQCDVIVSVCPPHAAEEVADSVLAHGFQGIYLDANAISPQKALRIAEKMRDAEVDFVDGGIIGGPAWKPGETWLYLSGQRANEAAQLFAAGTLEVEVIGDQPGKASALKMCYAANSKGATALLCLVMAASESLGVRDDLERQWTRQGDSTPQLQHRVRKVTEKAWRFAGEMEEMVTTFEAIGLPGGFHAAAADLYRRMEGFKNAEALPELIEVLDALNTQIKAVE